MMKAKARKAPRAAAGSFEEEFQRRFDKIETDAKALGINWSVICREAGIARASPVRWRHKAPLSIKMIDRMAAVVEKFAKKKLAKPQ